MAQRAPKGSMISKQQPSTSPQNDLHFGGLLRGMLRGYASGCASGVCFARAPPSTNTYLGPRKKILTHIIHVSWRLLFVRVYTVDLSVFDGSSHYVYGKT